MNHLEVIQLLGNVSVLLLPIVLIQSTTYVELLVRFLTNVLIAYLMLTVWLIQQPLYVNRILVAHAK
jgi:hypothetical protein